MRKWREVRAGTALPRATQLLESSISRCPWKGVLHLPGRGADGVRKLSWRKWCQDFNLYLVFFWVGSLWGPVIVVKIISVLSDKDSFCIKKKKALWLLKAKTPSQEFRHSWIKVLEQCGRSLPLSFPLVLLCSMLVSFSGSLFSCTGLWKFWTHTPQV